MNYIDSVHRAYNENLQQIVEIFRLVDKYEAVMAGVIYGDENAIQDRIEELCKEIEVPLDEVMEWC